MHVLSNFFLINYATPKRDRAYAFIVQVTVPKGKQKILTQNYSVIGLLIERKMGFARA